MKKVKYRCPACKTVQWVEYSPILSRTLQCQKCEAKFNAAYSKPNGAASQKKCAPQPHRIPMRVYRDCVLRIAHVVLRIAYRVLHTAVAVFRNTHHASREPALSEAEGTNDERRTRICAALLLIAATLIVVGLGFMHVITGSNLSAPHIVCKSSFGYSETFINIDRITGMPWVFAKSRYPVGCRVLQETGHIESDEAFESRIKREFAQLNR
jgi:hypothetical protein